MKQIVATLALCLSIPSAWPWGRLGHRVMAEMAQDRLTPRALAAVHELLGPGVSLADISSWADENREMPGTAPWHYVDVPITEARYNPRYCPSGGCIVSKIGDFVRVLENPKAGKAEKEQALKFLVHFVGDLHQPLHVGDTGSRGGNSIQVRFFNQGSNLHRVWDSQIMEYHTENDKVWLWDLNGVTNPKLAAEWSKGTVEDWATESLELAKQAYCLPGTKTLITSGTKLSDEYCRYALPVIQLQLAKAAVRLASLLNQIFR